MAHDRRRRQRLTGRRQVAQTRGDVHAVPDVVVPLHEDHIPACQPGANGDGLHRADLADDVVQFQNGLEERPGVDAHEHHAVTEPLDDANAPA